jgi:uncharacterized membrane protein YfcA
MKAKNVVLIIVISAAMPWAFAWLFWLVSYMAPALTIHGALESARSHIGELLFLENLAPALVAALMFARLILWVQHIRRWQAIAIALPIYTVSFFAGGLIVGWEASSLPRDFVAWPEVVMLMCFAAAVMLWKPSRKKTHNNTLESDAKVPPI